jgi:hypothetical protein
MSMSNHTQVVTAVKWGGEGLIYSASRDCTISAWDDTDGKLVGGCAGRRVYLEDVCCRPLPSGRFPPHLPPPSRLAHGLWFPCGLFNPRLPASPLPLYRRSGSSRATATGSTRWRYPPSTRCGPGPLTTTARRRRTPRYRTADRPGGEEGRGLGGASRSGEGGQAYRGQAYRTRLVVAASGAGRDRVRLVRDEDRASGGRAGMPGAYGM